MDTSVNDNLPVLREYNAIISGTLKTFVTISQKIGGELSTMTDHVTRLFNAQQKFIQKAIQSQKPANDLEMQTLIKPQSTEIEAICGKKEFLCFN